MKLAIFLFITSLGIIDQLSAQQCIDTVHIKGYYVQRFLKKDLELITYSDGTIVRPDPEGAQSEESYIPLDSISGNRPLSFWLNNFYYDTRTVYIKCATCLSVFKNYDCMGLLKYVPNSYTFPHPESEKFYRVPDLDTVHAYTISYLDAYWAKNPIERGTEKYNGLYFFKTVNQWIKPEVKKFYVLGFMRAVVIEKNAKFEEPSIVTWNP